MVEHIFQNETLRWVWYFRFFTIAQMLWLALVFSFLPILVFIALFDIAFWIWTSYYFLQSSRQSTLVDTKRTQALALLALLFVVFSLIWRRKILDLEDVNQLSDLIINDYVWFMLANITLSMFYFILGQVTKEYTLMISDAKEKEDTENASSNSGDSKNLDTTSDDPNNVRDYSLLFTTAAYANLFACISLFFFLENEALAILSYAGKIVLVPFFVGFACLYFSDLLTQDVSLIKQ